MGRYTYRYKVHILRMILGQPVGIGRANAVLEATLLRMIMGQLDSETVFSIIFQGA